MYFLISPSSTCCYKEPYDPTTAKSTKNSLKNRLRFLSNHFAIIPSRPVTQKKGIYFGAEERMPRPNSDRGGSVEN